MGTELKTFNFTACVGITIYASVEATSETAARKLVDQYAMGSISDCQQDGDEVWRAEELDGEARDITLEES